MKELKVKRVSSKVQELAREYRKKGYRVITEPTRSQLPAFIKNMDYQPDLIAMSGNDNLIFEVKTSTTVQSVKQFARVADSIKEHKGWDFVFVMTNPKKSETSKPTSRNHNIDDANEYLNKAENLLEIDGNNQFTDASLLLAWSGFEAVMRYAITQVYKKKSVASVASLIRDSVMYGIISKTDAKQLDAILITRNKISHGISVHTLEKNKVVKVIGIAKRAITDLEKEHITNASSRRKKPRG